MPVVLLHLLIHIVFIFIFIKLILPHDNLSTTVLTCREFKLIAMYTTVGWNVIILIFYILVKFENVIELLLGYIKHVNNKIKTEV